MGGGEGEITKSQKRGRETFQTRFAFFFYSGGNLRAHVSHTHSQETFPKSCTQMHQQQGPQATPGPHFPLPLTHFSPERREGSEMLVTSTQALLVTTLDNDVPRSCPRCPQLCIENTCAQGTWVAQSVTCLTSAQVLISRFMGSSPASGSVLTAWSLEPALGSVSPSLSAPPLLMLCPSLSLKNK